MSSQVRSVVSLALLYAFRMLGLFMVLPVMVLYGTEYEYATPMLLGLALGVYGLTQSFFQIPLGLLSDFIGRKPVIVAGLVVFALGSAVAAASTSVYGLILGRALQGCGAIASTVMAMVGDLTSEDNRTKAMAAIGASIGLSFTLAMILGPILAADGGLGTIFWTAFALSVVGIAIVIFVVPKPKQLFGTRRDAGAIPALIKDTARNPDLMRLNFGVFVLHLVLMACFIVVPPMFEEVLGLERAKHWQVYLPVLLGAFIFMMPFVMMSEKRKQVKSALLGAIAVLAVCILALNFVGNSSFLLLTAVFFFFVAFNLLEATLPSLVSKISPVGSKGTAMGLYATSQFFGAFIGGGLGGWLLQGYGVSALLLACFGLAVLWLMATVSMSKPRHLSSLCKSATRPPEQSLVLAVPGVVEALWVDEELLLYLKVDKDHLDEQQLDTMLQNYA